MDTALVIDDDPIAVELARALLTNMGSAHVSSASDGAAAKKLLAESGPFDLLLLDLMMPDCDGVEFLDHLHQVDYRGAIIISSGAEATVRGGATLLGMAYGLNVAGVLEKPLTLDKLVPALAHT